MPSSGFFLKNKIANTWISVLKSLSACNPSLKSGRLILPIILLAGVVVFCQGCAASKCDCPKFSGHRLSH